MLTDTVHVIDAAPKWYNIITMDQLVIDPIHQLAYEQFSRPLFRATLTPQFLLLMITQSHNG